MMMYRRLDPNLWSDRLAYRLWQAALLVGLLGYVVLFGGFGLVLLHAFAPRAFDALATAAATSPIWGWLLIRSARRSRERAASGKPPGSP